MEETGGHVVFPLRSEILATNRGHIRRTGGWFVPPDNLRSPEGLDWVLKHIQYSVYFGEDSCPTVSEKASYLTWQIIAGHVFYDAGKRTGMTTLIQFLDRNRLELDVKIQEIVDEAVRIAAAGEAKSLYRREGHLQWIRKHIKLKPRFNRQNAQYDLLQEHYRDLYGADPLSDTL